MQEPYTVSQGFRNTLTNAYRLERKNFYCPANPSWNDDSFWDSSGSSVLGYSYFAGYPAFNSSNNIPLYYPANGALPGGDNLRNHLPVFATNVTDQAFHPILWTDLNRRYTGSWTRGIASGLRGANHFGADKPLGQNEGYLDGRVEWAAFGKFSSGPKMIFGSVDIFFHAGRP